MKPKPEDYDAIYGGYISLIGDDDIIEVLEEQRKTSKKFLKSFTEKQGYYSYADGKWTVKEVLGHVIDTEKIMAYRALAIARGEKQSLPGFEQDEYVAESNFNNRSLDDLINEFLTARESNLILFKSFDEEIFIRRGIASESEVTVLALIYINAGHEKHHMKILSEKYGL